MLSYPLPPLSSPISSSAAYFSISSSIGILGSIISLTSIPGRLETWPVASSADSNGKYFKILPFDEQAFPLNLNLQSFHFTSSPFSRIPCSPSSPSDIIHPVQPSLGSVESWLSLLPYTDTRCVTFQSSRLCSLTCLRSQWVSILALGIFDRESIAASLRPLDTCPCKPGRCTTSSTTCPCQKSRMRALLPAAFNCWLEQ